MRARRTPRFRVPALRFIIMGTNDISCRFSFPAQLRQARSLQRLTTSHVKQVDINNTDGHDLD